MLRRCWQNSSFMYGVIEMDVPGTKAIADLYYISENICFLNYVSERPFSLTLSNNGSHCTMSPPLSTLMYHSALHREVDQNGCCWRRNDALPLKTGMLLACFENSSKIGVAAAKLFGTLGCIMARLHMQHCWTQGFSERNFQTSLISPLRALSTSVIPLSPQIHFGPEDSIYSHPHLQVVKYMCF